MSDLLLKNIREIYGVSSGGQSPPLSILIKNGVIVEIDRLENLQQSFPDLSSIKEMDCSDLIALPGYVDSHTHLLFAGSREDELYLRAKGSTYLEILNSGGGIYNTVRAVRNASEEQLIQNGLKYLDKALHAGTTTIEIKSGYGLDFENELKMLKVIHRLNELHPIDIVPTFLVHTVPKETDRKKYLDQVLNEMIPAFREYADWFDIFLEKGVFNLDEGKMLIQVAKMQGYHIGIHTNQVHDIGGVRLADELGVRHVDHLEDLDSEDAKRIIDNENLYAVFFPTAEAYVFSKHVGQIDQLLNISTRLVLSTDFNPGSSPVFSPGLVMSHAVLRYRISDPKLLIDAFTKNPANMLYLEDRGRLEKKCKGDVLLFNLNNYKQIPYWGVIDSLKAVIINGVQENRSFIRN